MGEETKEIGHQDPLEHLLSVIEIEIGLSAERGTVEVESEPDILDIADLIPAYKSGQ